MIFWSWLALLLIGCNNRDQNREPQKVAPLKKIEESRLADPAAPSRLFVIKEFDTPESFQYDRLSEKYFISNIGGAPTAKDGNGYISRLSADGKMDIKKFIIGLNAPKGICFHKQTLYVTDIDRILGYDPRTGKRLSTYDLTANGAKFLNDLVAWQPLADAHEATPARIYASDMNSDTIFALDPANKSIEVFSRQVARPNGLAVHSDQRQLLVASWTGKIFALDKHGNIVATIGKDFSNLDGLACDRRGRIYVSDFTQGVIYRIDPNGKIVKIVEELTTPADISLKPDERTLLVPCFDINEVFALVIPD